MIAAVATGSKAPHPPEAAAVLVVDDNVGKRLALQSALESLGHTVVEANSGEAALHAVMERMFAVILMDVQMPAINGYETAKLIRLRSESEHTPIIFITAHSIDETLAGSAYASGAVDIIAAPIIPTILRAKVSVFVDLFLKSRELEESLNRVTLLGMQFRDAEVRTRSVLENMADGIVTVSDSGLIESLNRAAIDMFGYSEAEAIGQPFSVVVAPKDERDADSYQDVAQPPAAPRLTPRRGPEFRGWRKNGSTFPIELNLSELRLGDRMVHINCVRDITERRRAEDERIRISHLAAVVDSADDAILSKDVTGKIVSWNRSAERLYGYSAGEAVGSPASMLLPADRPHEVADIFERLERGEHVARFETKRVRKDGSVIDVSLAVSPIRGVNGDVVGDTTIAQDIGERKVVEGRLRQLAAIVEASQDAMFSRTVEGNTLTWNAAAERLFGYSAEEMIGNPLVFLGEEGELSVGIAERRLRVDHGEQLPAMETQMRRKDGSQVAVSVVTSPITGASGDVTGVAVVVRDLTEQRRLEEQLRQSQKLEAIGSLAAGVAHDFSNVLTVIMAASDAILNGLDEGPLHTSASQIDKAATHAASLTRQLLAFGRQQVLVAQPTDLNELVDETLVLVSRLLSAEILIERSFGAALPSILIDRGQLQQIIFNLAINASDAMPGGGTIKVCTSTVLLDENSAADDLEAVAGAYVLLQLTDTGTGMSAETCKRIFDPFFTTKPTGTGLGLATVYGIVKQSGGHIDVHSELGNGTGFKIYLPPVVDAPAAALPAVKHGGGSLRGDETILLVEDFDALRALAVLNLTGSGYTVLAAADGAEALAIFTAHPGTVDLLLTDVVMPRMGGRELSEKLRAMNPDLKVLFTSGYPNDTVLRHGIGEAAVGFIQKPYRNEELLAKLRATLIEQPS